MRRAACFFVLVLAAGAAAVALAADETPPDRPAVSMWGGKSAVKEKAYLRVTTAEEWTALWLRHVGVDPAKHSAYYNEAGVPDVDFGRYMVLAVLQGERINSAGVTVVELSQDDERLLVRFDDRSFQTGGSVDGGAVHATPWGFFILPRTVKPVVLEENVQNMIGQPAKWKERARFPALGK